MRLTVLLFVALSLLPSTPAHADTCAIVTLHTPAGDPSVSYPIGATTCTGNGTACHHEFGGLVPDATVEVWICLI